MYWQPSHIHVVCFVKCEKQWQKSFQCFNVENEIPDSDSLDEYEYQPLNFEYKAQIYCFYLLDHSAIPIILILNVCSAPGIL